jgi:hypothetical protein
MDGALSFLYMSGCALLAVALTGSVRRKWRGETELWILAWFVWFFAIFLGLFFLLGYVDLFLDRPVVDALHALSVFAAVLFAVGMHRRRLLLDMPSHVSEIFGKFRGARASRVLALISVVFTAVALILLAGFPVGFEERAYHLPLAVEMLQTKSLKIWDSAYMHTYPANASVYSGILMSFLSEHFVAAAGLLFLLPLTFALYRLGRLTGADARASELAGLGFITLPIVAFSSLAPGADVAGAAFLAIAAVFAFDENGGSLSNCIICGLSAGLAFGFKSLHLIGSALVFGFVCCRVWNGCAGQHWPRRFRHIFTSAAVLIGSFSAVAGFWIVRNFVQLHNPLYPVYLPSIFHLFGWSKAPDIDFTQRAMTQFEWVRFPSEWLIYPWVEWHYLGENFKSSSGLGPFFAATVPAACAISVVAVLKRKVAEWPVLATLLSGGGLLLTFWGVLGDHQPRYFIGALVFLFPLVARMVSLATGQHRAGFEILLVFCIAISSFVLFSREVVDFGARFVYAKKFTRSSFYSYPAKLDSLPAGSTVLNLAERPWNFALFGAGHRNQVISYSAGERAFEVAAKAGRVTFDLRSAELASMKATHVFTAGSARVLHDSGIELREIDRLDTEPGIGTPLRYPEVLYEIRYVSGKPDDFLSNAIEQHHPQGRGHVQLN